MALGGGGGASKAKRSVRNVNVVARIRPNGSDENEDVVVDGLRSVLVRRFTYNGEPGEPDELKRSFSFDRAFGPDTSQEDIFANFKPLVLGALGGLNGTIFAYGQTGSGKTYTMMGSMDENSSSRSRGLIPRAIAALFREQHVATTPRFRCTYCEVYDDRLYDLLDGRNSSSSTKDWTKVSLQEDDSGGLHFEGLSYYDARSAEDALSLVFLGNSRRQVGSSRANEASSRSHAVFTIYVETEQTLSKLHFVDLAGSERFDVLLEQQQQLNERESRHINLSLHYLERVIVALQEDPSKKRHVPYRNSILTSMLRDSLGGNCQTAFIATLSAEHLAETTATCRFGTRCAMTQWEEATVVAAVDELGQAQRQLAETQAKLKTSEASLDVTQKELLKLKEESSTRIAQLEKTQAELAEQRRLNKDLGNHLSDAREREEAAKRQQEVPEDILDYDGFLDGDDSELVKASSGALRGLSRRLRDALQSAREHVVVEEEEEPSSPVIVEVVVEEDDEKKNERETAASFVDFLYGTDNVPEVTPPPMPLTAMPSTVTVEDPPAPYRALLRQGAALVKHTRRGERHLKYFWLDEADMQLCWRRVGANDATAESKIPIADFRTVDRGAPKPAKDTVLLNRGLTLSASADSGSSRATLTLQFDAGTLAASAALRENWLRALRFEIHGASPYD